MSALLVSKVVPASALPFAHAPVQVYSLRAVCEVAKAVRNFSATPPFSTRSPSGLSEPCPMSVGAKGLRKFQNVEAVVQKLRAELEMKPVAALVPRTFTLTGIEVAANTLLTDWTSPRIWFRAATISEPPLAEDTAKYLPLPLSATLCISAVMAGPWPEVLGSTSRT